jgi:hypothetical protein
MKGPSYLLAALVPSLAFGDATWSQQEPACCARVLSIESELYTRMGTLEEALQAKEREMALLRAEVSRVVRRMDMRSAAESTTPHKKEPPPTKVAITPDSASSAPDGGRRLSSAASYAAAPAWQVHEFPSGHQCGTTSRMRLVPTTSSGVSFSSAVVADSTTDLSLLSLGSGWAQTPIQSIPASLRIVHDVACASAPTMHFGMGAVGTSLALDSLTVNGSAVSGHSSDSARTHSAFSALFSLLTHVHYRTCVAGVGGPASRHELRGQSRHPK